MTKPPSPRTSGAETIEIGVDIGLGQGSATVWTCDLTHSYVHQRRLQELRAPMADTGHLLLAYFLTEIIACITPGPAVAGGNRHRAHRVFARHGRCRHRHGTQQRDLVCDGRHRPQRARQKRAARRDTRLGGHRLSRSGWASRHGAAIAHLAVQQERARISAWRGFSTGVAVQLSNPQALVFFTVFLPPFVNVDRPVAPQLLVLAIIGIATEIMVLTGYGLLAYKLGGLSLSTRSEKRLGHIQGALLIAIGLGMAMLRLGYL